MNNPITAFANLDALAEHLRRELENKKYILLYAYNGTGKTRLSMAFKDIGKQGDARDTLYFNAFTEDLFIWDNDLEGDSERVLKINSASRFLAGLESLEMESRIRPFLHRYTDFDFSIDYSKWAISFSREVHSEAGTETISNIKVSRGEENIFIWCLFFAIVQLVLDDDKAEGPYKWVKYIYIDDPISSLDEQNAIIVANHLVQLFREAARVIPMEISTHHHLFFNVLHYELKNHFKGKASQYILSRDRHSGGYRMTQQKGDTPSFHHVAALVELCEASRQDKIQTYHFNILRTILEKTALFHGYGHFGSCIKRDPDDADGILHQRFIDLLSHGKYSLFEPTDMGEETKKYFFKILDDFLDRYPFNHELFPKVPEEAAP